MKVKTNKTKSCTRLKKKNKCLKVDVHFIRRAVSSSGTNFPTNLAVSIDETGNGKVQEATTKADTS